MESSSTVIAGIVTGTIAEPDYRKQVAATRAQLAALPAEDNELVLFDKHRAEVRAFAEMVDAASGDKLQELVPWLVERVETDDRRVVRIVPTETNEAVLRGRR
jgi:hypothetical protein